MANELERTRRHYRGMIEDGLDALDNARSIVREGLDEMDKIIDGNPMAGEPGIVKRLMTIDERIKKLEEGAED